MKFLHSIIGGLAGAVALNILHETVRRIDPEAPRIDLIGKEGLNKVMEKAGAGTLEGKSLYAATMVGDILSNSVYYSAIGRAKDTRLLLRGALLGLAGGIGALELTAPSGLDDTPVTRTARTKWMTVAYYLTGGLVTALVIKRLRSNSMAGE